VYFIRENFQNLQQKHKWALWMRHLVLRHTGIDHLLEFVSDAYSQWTESVRQIGLCINSALKAASFLFVVTRHLMFLCQYAKNWNGRFFITIILIFLANWKKASLVSKSFIENNLQKLRLRFTNIKIEEKTWWISALI
jgi:hypothetical protein